MINFNFILKKIFFTHIKSNNNFIKKHRLNA